MSINQIAARCVRVLIIASISLSALPLGARSATLTTNVSDPSAVPPAHSGPYLFLDWRYIAPGHVQWLDAAGKAADKSGKGLAGEEAERQVAGRANQLPYGIRITAQPARKIGPLFSSDQP